MKKSKVLAMALGLAMGVSASTALAAEAQDGAALSETAFNDVPQGHWAYSALEVLSKDGVLEGYPDGSFKGNETMTRYEMAQIIANAYKGGSFADDALIDGVRQELSSELKTLKKVEKQVKKNTAAINKMQNFVDKLEIGGFGQVRYENTNTDKYDNQNDNDRYYLSLISKYKVNDNWKVCTEWEINHKYGNYHNLRGDVNEGVDVKNPVYVGTGRADSKFYPRLWIEGSVNNKLSLDVGRKWRGLGFQVMAFGEETDGVTLNYKLNDSDLAATALALSKRDTEPLEKSATVLATFRDKVYKRDYRTSKENIIKYQYTENGRVLFSDEIDSIISYLNARGIPLTQRTYQGAYHEYVNGRLQIKQI